MRARAVSVQVSRVNSTRLTVVTLCIPFDATPEEVDQAFAEARSQVRVS